MSRKDVAAALGRLSFSAGFGDYVKTLESAYQHAIATALPVGTDFQVREDALADARVYLALLTTIRRDEPK